MQITSTFILAALFALKATSVVALPFDTSDVSSVEARDIADFDAYYEARSYDDELEFEARDFEDELDFEARGYDNEFDLDARDFDEYEYVQARVFSPKAGIAAAKKIASISKHVPSGSHSTGGAHSIGGSHSTGGSRTTTGGSRSNSRVHTSGSPHGALGGSRNGAGGSRSNSRVHSAVNGQTRQKGLGAPHSANHLTRGGVARPSRFQSKINSEHGKMQHEESMVKKMEQRLKTQKKDMSLQEQVHKDRQLLRQDNAF